MFLRLKATLVERASLNNPQARVLTPRFLSITENFKP